MRIHRHRRVTAWAALGLLAMLIGQGALPAADDYVWWEAETPADTNFPKDTWLSAKNLKGKGAELSGGEWLTVESKRAGAAPFAKYSITVPADGEYDLWVRKYWYYGAFQWKFDDAAWRPCAGDCVLADSTPLVTWVSANWVELGKVKLTRGAHTFTFELTAAQGAEEKGAYDCFLLTTQPFLPHGKLKPGEKSGLANPGYFPWEPDADDFSAKALLDLRSLNEKVAGQSGFVQRTKDGHFALGDGTPVRFWGVNAAPETVGLPHALVDELAGLLAKRGVNVVRLHGGVFEADDPMQVNPTRIDAIQYFVTAMKKQGIYCEISFYFPLWLGVRPSYGLDGYDPKGNQHPFGLLFFNAKMQAFYHAWAKAILTTPNPYRADHAPLGQDPAVALVELQNEDSLLFWTLSKRDIPAVQWQALETLYGAWLAKKYGTLAKAFEAWGEKPGKNDDLPAGRAELFDAWAMTSQGLKVGFSTRKMRVGDQVHFLVDLQRGFYADTVKYFRTDLKAKNLCCASNWQTADPKILEALEQYTYTPGDIIDRHGYFDAPHHGRDKNDSSAAWSVQVGHVFSNEAAVEHPEKVPLELSALEGYPEIQSEIGWTNPNLYRADFAFLTAAYGSLQDADGYFAFALGGADWDRTLNKFAASCPVILGNFPAYALMFRERDIKPGPVVFREVLDLKNLFDLKGSSGAAAQAFDALRLKDVPPGGLAKGAEAVGSFDPFAFFCGRVVKTFGTDTEDSSAMNLAPYIDRDQKVIKSATGELVWKYGQGLATIDTPKAQAVAGFLGRAGDVKLKNLVVHLKNEYGTVALVALDDRPIAQSKKLLLQVMTVERPYGFKASNGKDGTITDLGSGPMGVEKIDGSVSLIGLLQVRRAIPLDENGYPAPKKQAVLLSAEAGVEGMALLPDVVYYVLER